jgi:hypothetical protein
MVQSKSSYITTCLLLCRGAHLRVAPLNLSLNSAAIEAGGARPARQHRGAKCCLWRKIYISADEQTLEIRAIQITGRKVGIVPL